MNVFSDLKLNSRTSAYLQVIQRTERKILNKSIITHTPLPSRGELVPLLSINPNTVQKSYEPMEEEGILRTINNVKSVVYIDEQIIECLQQGMIQEAVDGFIANRHERELPFQEVVTILSTRWDI